MANHHQTIVEQIAREWAEVVGPIPLGQALRTCITCSGGMLRPDVRTWILALRNINHAVADTTMAYAAACEEALQKLPAEQQEALMALATKLRAAKLKGSSDANLPTRNQA